MKRIVIVIVATLGVLGGPRVMAGETLALKQTIPLGGVSGRIDHMAIDVAGKRLFVAALGNNTVEVIDLAGGKRAGTIAGLSEPQGMAFIPELGRIVIACGGDGTVRFHDGKSLRHIKTIDFGDDADNLRYDPAARRVYVGYGKGAIGVLNAETGERIADIKLSGHPESFQLETAGNRIFVNVPSARQVAVIERQKAVVVATWPLKDVRSNFPMALDEKNHRLLIGCRSPARLLALDTESGRVAASLDCAGDVDDVFYDPAARRVWLSGGQGRVADRRRSLQARQPDSDRLRRTHVVLGEGAEGLLRRGSAHAAP